MCQHYKSNMLLPVVLAEKDKLTGEISASRQFARPPTKQLLRVFKVVCPHGNKHMTVSVPPDYAEAHHLVCVCV